MTKPNYGYLYDYLITAIAIVWHTHICMIKEATLSVLSIFMLDACTINAASKNVCILLVSEWPVHFNFTFLFGCGFNSDLDVLFSVIWGSHTSSKSDTVKTNNDACGSLQPWGEISKSSNFHRHVCTKGHTLSHFLLLSMKWQMPSQCQ